MSPAEAVRDWSWYEQQICRVIDKTDAGYYPDDLLTCIQNDTMQLWRSRCGKGMAITEIHRFPRWSQFLVYIVAGDDVRSWLAEGHRALQDFAREFGCTRMEFHGREGWEPFVRQLGYTRKLIRMTRYL